MPHDLTRFRVIRSLRLIRFIDDISNHPREPKDEYMFKGVNKRLNYFKMFLLPSHDVPLTLSNVSIHR